MSTTRFSWLHLTDLHYGLDRQGYLWPNLRQPFLDDLKELRKHCGPWNAVFFTGDLVQSGGAEQFEQMQKEFLTPLWQRLGELDSGDAVLLAVPGNHDLNRMPPAKLRSAFHTLRNAGGFDAIADEFWKEAAGNHRRVIDKSFAAYMQWWHGAPHRPADDSIRTGVLPGDFAVTVPVRDRKIGIVGLNTAFLQLGEGDYKGQLVWALEQIGAPLFPEGIDIWEKQHDTCILLSHHGPDWLTPKAQSDGRTEIAPATRFAFQLFGHNHEPRISYLRSDGAISAQRLLQGCSVFGMEKYGNPPSVARIHGYSAGQIEFDGERATLRLWPRAAVNRDGPWEFIPDYVHAKLTANHCTHPEELICRQSRRDENEGPSLGAEPVQKPDLDHLSGQPIMADFGKFDCFLSHNNRDKSSVHTLAKDLRARGISVWLDEEQLRPGVPWQPLRESGIRVSGSVAVLVGADGLGPWENEEMRAALSFAVEDGRPVIPVLLADAPAAPELPIFLRARTWVDLRPQAKSGDPLDRLIWGITGNRPDGASQRSSARTVGRNDNQGQEPEDGEEANGGHDVSYDHISDLLKRVRFQPFLGPLCYRTPAHYRAALRFFKSRLDALPKDKQEECDFINSVAKSRIPSELFSNIQSITGMANETPPTNLTELQVALAQVGLIVCRAIADQMGAKKPPGVTDLPSFEIALSDDIEAQIRHELTEAISAARNIGGLRCEQTGPGIRPCQRTCLAQRGIVRCLESLRTLVGNPGASGRKHITLGQFEWVGDLLWHTLRFDAPMIPEAEDLAFQLSLVVAGTGDSKHHRPPMGEAASGPGGRAGLISAWLACYNSRADRVVFDARDDVHAVMARFLSCRKLYKKDEEGQVETATLVTSNLDAKVESVLEDEEVEHNVLFPVTITHAPIMEKSGRYETQKSAWLLLTRSYKGGKRDDWWVCGKEGQNLPADEPWRDRLAQGPLLVKLRGSPLHGLPEVKGLRFASSDNANSEWQSRVSSIEHSIYLKDSAFFDYMLNAESGWPGFLRTRLTEGTSCLLGYPLPDPHIRLAFHVHVRFKRSGEKGKTKSVLFVDHPPDPFHERVFMDTKIDYVRMELEEFTQQFYDDLIHLCSN
jgi:hypothetical protein